MTETPSPSKSYCEGTDLSLSKPRGTTSPVQRRFDLKLTDNAAVTYYDRDTKATVPVTTPNAEWELDKVVPLADPFEFIVLDVLSFIGGFHEPSQSGIWSNEVRSTRDQKFVVRTKKGVLVEGLYEVIKEAVKADGGKFGNSVYIAYKDAGEWKLGNLKLIGAGVSAFFDFKDGKYLDSDPGVAITGWVGKKKGRNEYFEPVFASWEVDASDLAAAVAIDEALQVFLESSAGARTEEEPEQVNGYGDSDMEDEPPF